MSAWSPGARVDDYELESLGGGGMGDVFRARHLPTGTLRAIKALPRSVSEEALLRFRREAEAQAVVDAHPNVVRIHTAGHAEGRHYLLAEREADPEAKRRRVEEAARQGDPRAMERLAGLLGSGAQADAWLERARRRRLVTGPREKRR